MPLDIDKYIAYLDETNLSPSDKQQLIRALWGFIEGHIDHAFHINSIPPPKIKHGEQSTQTTP